MIDCCRLLIVWCALWSGVAQADDWPRFRGPLGAGVAKDCDSVPSEWSSERNLAWRTPLPGPGASSPIIVGGKVFVTCYSGYGVTKERQSEIGDLVRHLVCLDLVTGNVLWRKDIAASLPEDSYYESGVSSHGYASHTPCSDGTHVYCFFGKGGVVAFDFDGNVLWQADAGKQSDPPKWGSSSSPVVFNDQVIVTAAAESQSVIAFDKATGERRWQYTSKGLDGMWGTPALVNVNSQRTDLAMLVPGELWGIDPQQGNLLWSTAAADSRQAYTSIVSRDSRVYAFSGQGGGGIAVQIQASAEEASAEAQMVTDPLGIATLWSDAVGATYASPVLYQSKLYVISRGILTVVDAEDGARLKQIRLKGAKLTGNSRFGSLDYASPIIAGNRLFYLNASGQMYVFRIEGPIRLLSVNRATDEKELFWGSPAASSGRLVFRSSKAVYCVSGQVDP